MVKYCGLEGTGGLGDVETAALVGSGADCVAKFAVVADRFI